MEDQPEATALAVVHHGVGRPSKEPPANAAERIREAARKGSRRAVALALRVHHTTLEGWLKRYPELQEAFDEGWSEQEQTYVTELAHVAMDRERGRDQVLALFFMLNNRFGWNNGPQDGGGRSNVTINLPGAMSPEQYRNALQQSAVVTVPRETHG